MHCVRWRLVQSTPHAQRRPGEVLGKQLERWALLLDGDDDGDLRPRQRRAPVDYGEVAARNKKRGR
jgi:hypothetical protein